MVAPTVISRPVVEQHAQLFDVIDGLPRQQGMRAAGVVADHAAQRAAAMRRRVGAERQLVALRSIAQRIEHHARLDARKRLVRVDLQDSIHVLGEVQNHGNVAALAGQARASPARQHRRAEFAARRNRRLHVVRVARNHQTNGNLAIVRAVGGVQRPAAAIEAHFAAHHSRSSRSSSARLRETNPPAWRVN